MTKRLIWFFISLFITTFLLFSENTTLISEGFSYEIDVFNSKNYINTYSIPQIEKIYLLANEDSFISAKYVVFEKNISLDRFKRRLDTLDRTELGKLEIIKSGNLVKEIEQEKYILYNSPGPFQYNWEVFRGDRAVEEYLLYKQRVKKYQEKLELYNEYIEKLNETATVTIQKYIEDNKYVEAYNYSIFVEETIEKLPKPQSLNYSLSSPKTGFIINLEEGEYIIRFKNEEGNIFEGSEKKLVVFDSMERMSTGYEIIPELKWTRREYNFLPESITYINGKANIFIIPYYQNKYIDEYITCLMDNQGNGNKNFSRWEKIEQIKNVKIEIYRVNDKKYDIIEEKPYIVEPTDDARLGYNIIRFDEEKHPFRTPSFFAYNIIIPYKKARIELHTVGIDGEYFKKSRREIRVVNKKIPNIFVWMSLLPLFLGFILIGIRIKK